MGDKSIPERRSGANKYPRVKLDGIMWDRQVEFGWGCRVIRLGW